MSKAEDNMSIQDHLANFVSKYKTLLLVGIIAIVAGALGFGIFSSIIQASLEAEDQIVYDVEEWQRGQLQDLFILEDEARDVAITAFVQGTEERLQSVGSGVSKQKILHSTASTLFQLEEYESAAEWYKNSYEAKKDSLLGLYSLKGEADALTQSEDRVAALAKYIELESTMPEDFPMQDEILMTLGALYEDNADTEKALEIYNRLVIDFADSNWTKLARSRILVLE